MKERTMLEAARSTKQWCMWYESNQYDEEKVC